jgi:hypothetical protein
VVAPSVAAVPHFIRAGTGACLYTNLTFSSRARTSSTHNVRLPPPINAA